MIFGFQRTDSLVENENECRPERNGTKSDSFNLCLNCVCVCVCVNEEQVVLSFNRENAWSV
jgi:hypothetical protein